MGHGHTHFDVSVGVRRTLALASGMAAIATVIGLIVLWPPADPAQDVRDLGFTRDLFDAKVESVTLEGCPGVEIDEETTCTTVHARLLQGPDKGETTVLDLPVGDTGPDVSIGDVLVLSYEPTAPDGFKYGFADKNRKPVLWWLAGLFALTVVILGRLRGLAALAGLGASFVVLLKFILPAVLAGTNPLAVATIGAAAIAFVALYLAHGFGPKTSVALLGTLGSLVVTIGLASVFVGLADFSGFSSEEAGYLRVAGANIDLAGLILGGIVIGALGALDDMTVTQASVVAELHDANPELGPARLFGAAMRIGRDHVASTVNTLALAYAGASMPLLVLFVLSEQSLGSIVNGEVIAIEVVRTLVGSIGLVASVPLTTWLAVLALGQRPTFEVPAWVRRLRPSAPS